MSPGPQGAYVLLGVGMAQICAMADIEDRSKRVTR